MLGLVAGFPEQCERARDLALSSPLPEAAGAKNAVIAGMGGSAIGGDILAAAFESDLRVPVQTCRAYKLPAYVSGDSLVICTSYSGNTEETLSIFADADARCAQIVCICSGGKLAELAAAKSHPVIDVPGGQPPRSATGYLLIPQIVVLERTGLLPSQTANLEHAVELLKEQRARLAGGVPSESNQAKRLAAKLFGRVPIVYGSSRWAGVVAYRWKTQINENAKVHAFAHAQSELSHNEILAWQGCDAQTIEAAVVNIRDRDESARVRKRVEVTNGLVTANTKTTVADVWAEGETTLQKILTAAYVGDFTSVYLGLLQGTDPTPIAGIDVLKAELDKVES